MYYPAHAVIDGVNPYECRLDGASFAPCTSPFTPDSPLALGSHVFEVRAVDLHGNADPTPAQYAWTIVAPPPDVTPPDTFIDESPDATTVLTDASFAFSSDEDDVTFECFLDNTPVPTAGPG